MAIGSILNITDEGINAETQSLSTGVMPIIKDFVIDGGAAYDGYDARHLISEVYSLPILAKNDSQAGLTEFKISIPPEVEFDLRGFALRLDDGTIYAYSRYVPQTDGIYKSRGMGLQFHLVLARKSDVTFDFTYSPLDIGQMATELTTKAREALDLYLEGDFLGFLQLIDGVRRTQND
ncbi:MAG: hypothetical protein Q9M50_14150 [Methylococcales bacterium]|nr:hypothetical protein [Methylococcales bacterium]